MITIIYGYLSVLTICVYIVCNMYTVYSHNKYIIYLTRSWGDFTLRFIDKSCIILLLHSCYLYTAVYNYGYISVYIVQ